MSLFNQVRQSLKIIGLIKAVFTFVDASQLVSKLSTWDNRDKAIKQGLKQFNNQTAHKVSADKQARFGGKGKDKYGYGYKEHASVDMQSGLINKVAATQADTTDAKGLKHICPTKAAVLGDKGYGVNPAKKILKQIHCHNATIQKNNMKHKNKDKDLWLSGLRSPDERVLAHRNKRLRYQGLAKAQFQVGARALVFNFKRLIRLGITSIE